jgi:hypothetical protein
MADLVNSNTNTLVKTLFNVLQSYEFKVKTRWFSDSFRCCLNIELGLIIAC